MPDSDDEYGSGHDYSSPDDTDSEHEEQDSEQDNHVKKRLLELLSELERLIQSSSIH